MKDIQYFDILKNAFLVTWKNKFLWFFGFLVFLGSFGSNLNMNNGSAIVEQGKKIKIISTLIQNNPNLFTALSFILVLIIIALFLLRIIAVAGIVKSVNNVNLYRQLSVVAILKEAKKYLWRLLLLEFLVGIVLVLVTLVLATPVLYLFALNAKLLASCALVAAIVIIVPLIILAYYLHRYASFYIILANEKLGMSLESAYAIFAKNIKESLVMGLLTIVTSFLSLAVIIFSFVFLAIVFAPLSLIAYLIFAETGAMVFLIIAILLCIIVFCAIFSLYESFLQAAWLLFFQQIALEKHKEKKISEKLEVEGKIPSPEVV